MSTLLENYECALERNLGAFEDACRLKSTTKASLKYQYTTCLEMLQVLDRYVDAHALSAKQKNSRAMKILSLVEKNSSSISMELQNFVSLYNTKAWDL